MPDAGSPTLALQVLDLVGVFAFALSGGLVAVRKRFDLWGVLVLSVCAGLGGGVLRDVLIGATPPVAISEWRFITAATAAGLVTFLFHPGVGRITRLVLVLDAIGLGLFAIAGSLKALELGHGALTAITVGVLTGIGGGMLRDLLAGEVPTVLASRDLYAVPAFAGCALFSVLWESGAHQPSVTAACAVLISAIRLAAMHWGWQAPLPRR